MLTYRHKDGRTQQVQEREKVKISILERSGWKRDAIPPAGDDSPAAREMRAIAAAKDAEQDAALNERLGVREVLSAPDTPKRRSRSKAK